MWRRRRSSTVEKDESAHNWWGCGTRPCLQINKRKEPFAYCAMVVCDHIFSKTVWADCLKYSTGPTKCNLRINRTLDFFFIILAVNHLGPCHKTAELSADSQYLCENALIMNTLFQMTKKSTCFFPARYQLLCQVAGQKTLKKASISDCPKKIPHLALTG